MSKRIIVLHTGEKYTVLEEKGKFWICDGITLHKANPDIKEIVEEETKKKATAKKQKEVE